MFIAYLGKHNIHAPGVLNKKKLAKGHITSDKHLENQARGYTEQKPSTNKSSKKITVVGWNDNCAVYLASNCLSSDPAKSVCRWTKVERKYIEVKQPNRFYCYNRNMSFADKMDQNVAKCRIGIQMNQTRAIRFPIWWCQTLSGTSKKQSRCNVCKKNLRRSCVKCNVNLHDECFETFHGY